MKLLVILLMATSAISAYAEEKLKMYFNNEELTKIVEIYSKASGQKFVLDPGVRGRVSIFIQEPVSISEAFNQLSSALAINGFAISKQGDTMIVKSARNIQRDLIEVSQERPSVQPERMYTWIYKVKNIPAGLINRDLRILTSKDGEMTTVESANQLIFSDWASNIIRIADLMKEVDIKPDPAVIKLVEDSKKERVERMKVRAAKSEKSNDEKPEEKKSKTEN